VPGIPDPNKKYRVEMEGEILNLIDDMDIQEEDPTSIPPLPKEH